jgi:hypothetical protein
MQDSELKPQVSPSTSVLLGRLAPEDAEALAENEARWATQERLAGLDPWAYLALPVCVAYRASQGRREAKVLLASGDFPGRTACEVSRGNLVSPA